MRQGSRKVRQRGNNTIDMRRQDSRVDAADASVEEDDEGCVQGAQHMAMGFRRLSSGSCRREIARADEVLKADTAAVQGLPCFEAGILACVLCAPEGLHDVCETGCLGEEAEPGFGDAVDLFVEGIREAAGVLQVDVVQAGLFVLGLVDVQVAVCVVRFKAEEVV